MILVTEAFKKVVELLNECNIDYLIIGGIATGVIGEPRQTYDVDICVFIKKKELKGFLTNTRQRDFTFEEGDIKNRLPTGTFKVFYKNTRIDFIIASTPFEKSALKRKQKIVVYDTEAYFPTPEDLIIFKIVPSRPKDINDIEAIVKRHSGKLDWKYLESWGQRISDMAEDMRVYAEIKKLRKIAREIKS